MERPYSRSALISQGPKHESSFLFFYGHNATKGPQAMLSNFWRCPQPFTDEANRQFPTSEHFMMHGKAVLFGDEQMATAILNASTPLQAKRLGRKVRNFEQETWEAHRVAIVAEGCFLKFSQCEEARRFLLATGNRTLVEAAKRDYIWGIGMDASNRDSCNPSKWRGLNLLGEALMIVRDRLRDQLRVDIQNSSSTMVQSTHDSSVHNSPL